MDLKTLDLKTWLARSPLVAILRGVEPGEVEAIVEVLAESRILAASLLEKGGFLRGIHDLQGLIEDATQ